MSGTVTKASIQSLPQGQRIFTCGHSFHARVIPDMLADLAQAAGISGHRRVGTSAIGASRAIQHWEVPEEQNEAKRSLRAGIVDVLTLSCMSGPDEGIANFVKLAVAHNPGIRVTLQELWLPEDRFPFDAANRVRRTVAEFDDSTMADLRKAHAAYFKVMEDYVTALNAEIGRPSLLIVPDAQATLALRERILSRTAPGLGRQSELFTDAWGHPAPPLKLLSVYCHFAVIYRRSPVGLPLVTGLGVSPDCELPLNRLLQELAWEAVTQHPLSGLRASTAREE
jgi:hypothetical protein